MKEPVLLILAAGMGSRYGGLKQIDPIGPNGEIIIDYSLYDAKKAGFKKAVFVIKEENREDFERILSRASKHMEIEYVYQNLNDIPSGCALPEGREKPWGTGHAVLVAEKQIDGAPFAAINADDFYGRESFKQIYNFLKTVDENDAKKHFAMVGFMLKNTVTENGFVSRGVCEQENGLLKGITERVRIEKLTDGIAYTEDDGASWIPLADDTIVSMNKWGFTSAIFTALHEGMENMFETDVKTNPLKCELFLPAVVNDMLVANKADVKVLSSRDKWYGVTHSEDKEFVAAALRKLSENGTYPKDLWA